MRKYVPITISCKGCGREIATLKDQVKYVKGFYCIVCRPKQAVGANPLRDKFIGTRKGKCFRRGTDRENTLEVWECVDIDRYWIIGEYMDRRDIFNHNEVVWKKEII